MNTEPLTKIDQIKNGDLLLIDDGVEILFVKVQRVKVSDHDGTEVIFDLKRNKYFNVGRYLDGTSWAKDVRVASTDHGVEPKHLHNYEAMKLTVSISAQMAKDIIRSALDCRVSEDGEYHLGRSADEIISEGAMPAWWYELKAKIEG